MASLFVWDDDDKKVPDSRSGHVCCQLEDSIFVWGGYNDLRQEHRLNEDFVQFHTLYMDPSATWFYYPFVNKWQRMRTSFPYPNISSGAGAVYVPSKSSVYLFFGFSDLEPKNCIYSFDILKYKWQCINEGTGQNKRMPSPRDKFVLWEFRNKVYIFGGYGAPLSGYLNDKCTFDEDYTLHSESLVRGWNNQLLEFEVETERWREVPCLGDIPSTRAAHSATRVKEWAFVFGGRHKDQRLNDLYQLNLLNMQWTNILTFGPTPCGRSWHSLVHLNNDEHLVVVGGYSSNGEVLGDVWLFDIKLKTWSECVMPSSNTKRLWHSTTITRDNEVVVFGGCLSDIYSPSPTHTNDLVVLRFSPDSLFRLTAQVIIGKRNIFEFQLYGIPYSCRSLFKKAWKILDSPHLKVM